MRRRGPTTTVNPVFPPPFDAEYGGAGPAADTYEEPVTSNPAYGRAGPAAGIPADVEYGGDGPAADPAYNEYYEPVDQSNTKARIEDKLKEIAKDVLDLIKSGKTGSVDDDKLQEVKSELEKVTEKPDFNKVDLSNAIKGVVKDVPTDRFSVISRIVGKVAKERTAAVEYVMNEMIVDILGDKAEANSYVRKDLTGVSEKRRTAAEAVLTEFRELELYHEPERKPSPSQATDHYAVAREAPASTYEEPVALGTYAVARAAPVEDRTGSAMTPPQTPDVDRNRRPNRAELAEKKAIERMRNAGNGKVGPGTFGKAPRGASAVPLKNARNLGGGRGDSSSA